MGALNASKMKFCFDERIQTNVVANFTQIYEYENLHIKKGERLGNFELFENKELKFTEAIRLIK